MLVLFAGFLLFVFAVLFVMDEVIRYQRRKHLASFGGGNSYANRELEK